jgi:hypothetical protein
MSTQTLPTPSTQPQSTHPPIHPSTHLPITHALTLPYALTLIIALLVAIAAIAGLLFRDTIYPTGELVLAFLPVDGFHLVVGLPVLLGAMALARRGHLAGLLCWPGALLYVLYSYVTNLIGVPFGVLFLPYLLLATLSAYALIALLASIDGPAVQQRLAGAVPVRAAGGLLLVLTGLFVLNAVAEIATALAGPADVGPLDRMLWIADLTTIGPAALAGGVLLLQRQALGYVGGTGLLLTYSLLFIGLLPVMLFPALYDGSPVDGAGTILMLICGLISLALLARFVRAAVPAKEV